MGLTPGDTVDVDADMRVQNAPRLYAIGVVNGRTLHTHMRK